MKAGLTVSNSHALGARESTNSSCYVVLGIESPGLTSSIAIAEYVRDLFYRSRGGQEI